MYSSQSSTAIQHEKIVMLGETCVGKSCIVTNFIQHETIDQAEPTIGASFMSKKVTADNGTTICLEIWDTAGQERYRSLAPMYYRGANSAIIVMDITNKDSFHIAKYWAREVSIRGTPDCHLVFAVNKTDMDQSQWEFSLNDVDDYLTELKQDTGKTVAVYSTSAKTNTKTILTMFSDITEIMSMRQKQSDCVANKNQGFRIYQPETTRERLRRSFDTLQLMGATACTIL
jgi:small GTP-binding protein